MGKLNAPSNLTAGSINTANETVVLKWNDNSNNEIGFKIERRSYNSGTAKWSSWSQAPLVESIGENSTTATAKVALLTNPITAIQFRVCAFNNDGAANPATPNHPKYNSDWSNVVTVTKPVTKMMSVSPSLPLLLPDLAPAPYMELQTQTTGRYYGKLNRPTDLTAGSFNTENQTVVLNWKDNSNGVTGNEQQFHVERRWYSCINRQWRWSTWENADSKVVSGSLKENSTTATVKAAVMITANATQMQLRVCAHNMDGVANQKTDNHAKYASDWSNVVTVLRR
jgi:hypothetical protein